MAQCRRPRNGTGATTDMYTGRAGSKWQAEARVDGDAVGSTRLLAHQQHYAPHTYSASASAAPQPVPERRHRRAFQAARRSRRPRSHTKQQPALPPSPL